VFTVKKPSGNKIPLNEILKEFGYNIPVPCPYEGCMDGIVHLCCVDIDVDVAGICEKYGYNCGHLFKLEIDPSKFNNEYMILPTYSRDPPHYSLEKVRPEK
jgi:hypothetical protein